MASLDDREARLRRREEIKAAASAEAAAVSPCARAVVLVKDVVRRALDGQIDGQRGCVACLP